MIMLNNDYYDQFVKTNIDEFVRQNLLRCLCSACDKLFYLSADTEASDVALLRIRGCESGGMYGCYVDCPHCKHRHELM